MSAVRLALLNAAHEGAQTRRNFRRELDAELVEFEATRGQLPTTFDFDGCVVTGSRSSVYWEEDWIPPLKAWLREALDRELPFLGVCYGHQILADVLGGDVEDMGEYEIGYREVVHFENTELFDGIDRRFTVFTTHSDRVRRLPDGATVLAANEYGIHGFRWKDVYGVQFHPEYDLETARTVTEGKELPEARKDAVLADITEHRHAQAGQSKQLFANFTDLVRQRRPQALAAD